MLYQHWLAFLLSLRGNIVQPRPRVQGDTWSRKVDLREREWQAAGACFERKLYSSAADWVIAASGNGLARIFEENLPKRN